MTNSTTEKLITLEEINAMSRLYKINLINSLSGYKSANLIGTKDSNNKENLAIFSSVVHIGSSPPLLAFITRPHTVPRHTLENINETGFYTINHISAAFYKEAHHTSAKYPKDNSEFRMTGLTPEYIGNFSAPFVRESNVKIGMKHKESIEIKINDTIMVIGEIQFFIVPESSIKSEGNIALNELDIVTISGLDTYHKPHYLDRMPYARPHQKI